MSARRVAAVVAILAVLAALPFVGRWEEHRNARTQNERMASVYRLAAGDGLVSSRLHLYRLAQYFACLLYSPPGDPTAVAALELCFDVRGRLVETIDRRTSSPHFASLREERELATLRVPVRQVVGALVSLGVYAHDVRLRGVSPAGGLPVGFDDIGAFPGAPRPAR